MKRDRKTFYKSAILLSSITIAYNILEGIISVYFGIEDETISLLGFGIDSFVEVISGAGIFHMVLRMRDTDVSEHDRFESRALTITGTAFFILSAGLVISASYNLYTGHSPETTFWGIVISLVSILTMSFLIHFKLRVARRHGSHALEADAMCTKTCLYLSLILLAASIGYEMTGIGGIDSVGAACIAWFAYKEARESFNKAKGISCGCSGHCKD